MSIDPVMALHDRDVLAAHVLQQARVRRHAIPRIVWDATEGDGSGTCTRCGDGVMLYAGPDGWSVAGTAYDYDCPGETCEHGWRIVRRSRAEPGGAVVLHCLHCGAERSEGTSGDANCG